MIVLRTLNALATTIGWALILTSLLVLGTTYVVDPLVDRVGPRLAAQRSWNSIQTARREWEMDERAGRKEYTFRGAA